MELTKEELELMIQHLTQQVAQLSTDKALLLARLELVQQQLKQMGQE